MSRVLPLSRGALARVLQSLVIGEWTASRGGGLGNRLEEGLPAVWPESLRMREADGAGLGVDSLEALRLAAAANEMFHLYESGCEHDLLTARTWGDWLEVVEGSRRAGVRGLTFSTSGSTGLPRRCPHEVASLTMEADYLADLFARRRRIMSLVPAHHIYGFLFTAMLADRLDLEVVGYGTPRPGDLVVAVPEQWAWMDRSVAEWPADVEGVTSTAPCSRALLSGLMERGMEGMTEVYGSSETAGVGTRRWPQEVYRWMPQWSVAEEGVIVHTSGRQVALMDRIALRGGGFVVEGRRDDAVQVGGTNVYPERVAARLRALPGVKDAVVRAMGVGEGVRLKAFAVPAAGWEAAALEGELERWAREKLAVAERPRSWAFGAELPVNGMGKAADW